MALDAATLEALRDHLEKLPASGGIFSDMGGDPITHRSSVARLECPHPRSHLQCD